MKNQTCCFSGHRDIPPAHRAPLEQTLTEEIAKLISRGVTCFVTGGALGFDTLAAQSVLSLQAAHPHIKLLLILPCKNQTRNWSSSDIEAYNQIKARAAKYIYTSEDYHRGCMHVRNRKMVDISAYLIAYRRKNSGGTAYTVQYAEEQNLQIIQI